jgi:hypothetical protein
LHSTETQLAHIGCIGENKAPVWQVARIGGAGDACRTAPGSVEPAFSAALLRWRERLRPGAAGSPYRISRIDDER